MGAGTEQMIIKSVAVLKAEDKRNNRVIEQMLADVGRTEDDIDSVLAQFLFSTDPTEYQELGRFEYALDTITSLAA